MQIPTSAKDHDNVVPLSFTLHVLFMKPGEMALCITCVWAGQVQITRNFQVFLPPCYPTESTNHPSFLVPLPSSSLLKKPKNVSLLVGFQNPTQAEVPDSSKTAAVCCQIHILQWFVQPIAAPAIVICLKNKETDKSNSSPSPSKLLLSLCLF